MKITLLAILALCILPHCHALEGRRLGGSLKGQRLDQPRRYDCVRRIDDDIKERKRLKAEKAQMAEEARRIAELERNKEKNTGLCLGLKSFCGKRFGEPAHGKPVEEAVASKKYFGGYSKLRLKYSPSAGLYSITAINDDAFMVGDYEKEMRRIIGVIEKRFNVKFTSSMYTKNNAVWGEDWSTHDVCDSVTGGIKGRRLDIKKVIVKPPTRWESGISELFNDFMFSLVGVKDNDMGVVYVEVTVEMIPKNMRPTP